VLEAVAVSWHPVGAPSVVEQPDGTSARHDAAVLNHPGNV
jgi:hypothetical protein